MSKTYIRRKCNTIVTCSGSCEDGFWSILKVDQSEHINDHVIHMVVVAGQ